MKVRTGQMRTIQLLKRGLLAIGLLLSFGVIAGVARDFPLGNLGSLQLMLDDNWKETRAPADAMPAISIEAKDPGRLHVLLTPLPLQGKTDRDIQQLVRSTADRIGPQSVEKTLTLQPLLGAEARGYYFKATDPAPKPGEFRLMYQGMMAVGPALVTFTVLFNAGAEKDAEAALSSLRGARFRAKSV